MADRNDVITDRRHLEQLTTRAIDDLVALARHWLAEDEAACAPRSTGTTSSRTTSHGDQTGSIATGRNLEDHETAPPVDRTKYADRDRLGGLIAGTARRLREELDRRKPRTPTGNCTCCRTETATHGHDPDGTPTSCWRCWRYLRDNDRPCGEDVHADRPKIRWCECPPTCCPQDDDGNTSCTDHVGENRTHLSDRCAQRLSRRRRAETA